MDFLPVESPELAVKNAGLPAHVLWEGDGSVTRELQKPAPGAARVDLEWMERRVWTWFWYIQSKI